MADEVVQVSEESYAQRVGRSFGAAVFGIVLFLASFALLWWNEGNIVAEKAALQEMQTKAITANPLSPKPAQNGKLIYAIGELKGSAVGDEVLAPGPYLAVERSVEMYQWKENKETQKSGSTKKTTYRYEKGWHADRIDSAKFVEPQGHNNPELVLQSKRTNTTKANFGAFDGLPLIEQLSPSSNLGVTAKSLKVKKLGLHTASIDGEAVMFKQKAGGGPTLGDLRVTYRVLKPGKFSVLGVQQSSKELAAYTATNGKSKLIVHAGNQTLATLIEEERQAAKMMAMIMRLVGFLMMGFGLAMVSDPLAALLSFIPGLESAGRFVLGGMAFAVAFVLSSVTILLGMMVHNPMVLVVVLAVGVGTVYWLRQRRMQAPQGSGALAMPADLPRPPPPTTLPIHGLGGAEVKTVPTEELRKAG